MNRTVCACVAVCVLAVCSATSYAAAVDPVGGARHDSDYLRPGHTMTYRVPVYGGQYTAVDLSGNGWSDLDLYIYDQWGNCLASRVSYSDQESATVYVASSQTLRIVVRNRGYATNWYYIQMW